MPLPLATAVSDEQIGANLFDEIYARVSDGNNHISLLNARIEPNDGDPQLVACVFSAKEALMTE